MTAPANIGLGWRIHSSTGIVVAVAGPLSSPTIVHRADVALIDDDTAREPYHAAAGLPLAEAPAFLRSVEKAAVTHTVKTVRGLIEVVGPVAAVGVVGGDRKLPELPKILGKHALLHAAERDLFAQTIVEAAARLELPVAMIPATGQLFAHASSALGVEIEPVLAAAGKAAGPPWPKDYREAAAAALVALHDVG